MHRRNFLQTAAAGGIALALPVRAYSRLIGPDTPAAGIPVFLDCDTANEIDDLFAIVRALLIPGWDIRGLASAQWQHQLSSTETVRESQQLNELILQLMGRQDIPAPMGSNMIIGFPWGGDVPRDSPAAQLLIRTARAMPAGQRLTVIATGAPTNVASAIRLAPDILPKVVVYQLGGQYYADRRVWNKDEFNVRRDLNAYNYLLNTEDLELHIMPVNVLFEFKMKLAEAESRLAGRGSIWDLLVSRWLSHDPGSAERIIWDLALVEAVAHPEWASEERRLTPPENHQREVWVYTRIDEAAMWGDWWATVGAG